LDHTAALLAPNGNKAKQAAGRKKGHFLQEEQTNSSKLAAQPTGSRRWVTLSSRRSNRKPAQRPIIQEQEYKRQSHESLLGHQTAHEKHQRQRQRHNPAARRNAVKLCVVHIGEQ
jgi:hypothetical protein